MTKELHQQAVELAEKLQKAGVCFLIAIPLPEGTKKGTRVISNMDEIANRDEYGTEEVVEMADHIIDTVLEVTSDE
jgi:hypothetical protein